MDNSSETLTQGLCNLSVLSVVPDLVLRFRLLWWDVCCVYRRYDPVEQSTQSDVLQNWSVSVTRSRRGTFTGHGDTSRQSRSRWIQWTVDWGCCRWIIYNTTGSLRLLRHPTGKKFKLKYWVHIDHMISELGCSVSWIEGPALTQCTEFFEHYHQCCGSTCLRHPGRLHHQIVLYIGSVLSPQICLIYHVVELRKEESTSLLLLRYTVLGNVSRAHPPRPR